MKVDNLVNKMTFVSGTLYSPPDPFGIYLRLAKVYLKSTEKRSVLLSINKVSPFNLFADQSQCYTYQSEVKPINFCKWALQSLPKTFWKFNVYIDLNLERIKLSAKEDDPFLVWTDMPGKKKKLKSCPLSFELLNSLRRKELVLADYESICKEVKSWGKYQYQYGNIAEQNVSAEGLLCQTNALLS